MENDNAGSKQRNYKGFAVLVPIDFSPFSVQALRTARTLMGLKPRRLLALHVIDRDFVDRCIRHSLGTEDHIKKTLFLSAKARLKDLLHKEGTDDAERPVCMGTCFLEINNQAIQCGADMVVMGSRENSGDMNNIFFFSTTERVLRFIKRPVLCVPLNGE